MVQALANNTPIKDPARYSVMGRPDVDPNGRLDLTMWATFQSYFVDRGLQEEVIDLQPFVDSALLESALDTLGREQ